MKSINSLGIYLSTFQRQKRKKAYIGFEDIQKRKVRFLIDEENHKALRNLGCTSSHLVTPAIRWTQVRTMSAGTSFL